MSVGEGGNASLLPPGVTVDVWLLDTPKGEVVSLQLAGWNSSSPLDSADIVM